MPWASRWRERFRRLASSAPHTRHACTISDSPSDTTHRVTRNEWKMKYYGYTVQWSHIAIYKGKKCNLIIKDTMTIELLITKWRPTECLLTSEHCTKCTWGTMFVFCWSWKRVFSVVTIVNNRLGTRNNLFPLCLYPYPDGNVSRCIREKCSGIRNDDCAHSILVLIIPVKIVLCPHVTIYIHMFLSHSHLADSVWIYEFYCHYYCYDYC